MKGSRLPKNNHSNPFSEPANGRGIPGPTLAVFARISPPKAASAVHPCSSPQVEPQGGGLALAGAPTPLCSDTKQWAREGAGKCVGGDCEARSPFCSKPVLGNVPCHGLAQCWCWKFLVVRVQGAHICLWSIGVTCACMAEGHTPRAHPCGVDYPPLSVVIFPKSTQSVISLSQDWGTPGCTPSIPLGVNSPVAARLAGTELLRVHMRSVKG